MNRFGRRANHKKYKKVALKDRQATLNFLAKHDVSGFYNLAKEWKPLEEADDEQLTHIVRWEFGASCEILEGTKGQLTPPTTPLPSSDESTTTGHDLEARNQLQPGEGA